MQEEHKLVNGIKEDMRDKKKIHDHFHKDTVCHIANLPYDLVFKIFLLLPGNFLFRIRSVCKAWRNLIDNSTFAEAHVRNCETGLVFLRNTFRKRPSFSIEEHGLMPEEFSIFERPSDYKDRYYISFLKLEGGKGMISESSISSRGDILASCDGLILATFPHNQGLVVINPVTGKLTRLPLGTIVDSNYESYGFMFSHYTSDYKVVHLFWNERGYVGCEILSLTTRSWHAVYRPNLALLNRFADRPVAVDEPNLGVFNSFLHRPVSVVGALYWLRSGGGHSDLVSLSIIDEKFRAITLPITSTVYCRLVEFCGFLSFVTHVTLHRIQVWMLRGGPHEEKWTRQYNIIWDHDVRNLVPFFTSRNGRKLVFSGPGGTLYAYDFEDESMKRVELETQAFPEHGPMLPHVITLASW